jgi:glycosyltransferase involved in cell wall biosynthesis
MNTSRTGLWLNVTMTAGWTGQPMGVVRVEAAMSRELPLLCGSKLRFCVWEGGDFVEWTPGHVRPAPSPQPASGSRRRALASIGRALVDLAPRQLQPIGYRLLSGLRGLWRWMRPHGGAVADSPPAGVIFGEGDVLVSFGLDWDQPSHQHLAHLRESRQIRIVTCCYDLIPVLYPQYCAEDLSGAFRAYFVSLAESSDLILCISRRTERDLLDFLTTQGSAVPQTCVIPLGDSVAAKVGEPVSDEVRRLVGVSFIMFVSTIECRKNHEILYRAYHLLCAEGRARELPKLVFVGMRGWGVDDFLKNLEIDPLTRHLIVILDRVSDGDLSLLYERALFCAFPSLYEGWGLPVGEALAAGKVVVASDRGSLPEVGGDLVRYVDAWNPRAWAEEIWRLSTDDALRRRLERRVKATYRPRTWSESALAVKTAIEALPSGASPT